MSADPSAELARVAARMRQRNRSARNNVRKAERDGDDAAAAAWRRVAEAHAADGRDLERSLRRSALTPTVPS